MMTFNGELKSIIEEVFQDLQTYSDHFCFVEALSFYIEQVEPVLLRYQLHHNAHEQKYDLLTRFQVETAILSVITELASALLANKEKANLIWPLFEKGSLHDWYRLTATRVAQIKALASSIPLQNELPAILSQVSDEVLSTLCNRYMGEFYTPLSIAQHLISVTEFHPSDLFEGKKLVDPACGGGIILSLVAQQSLEYIDENNIPLDNAWDSLNKSICGFDIQPFAVALTRTQLILVSVFTLGVHRGDKPLFTNVLLVDPLRDRTECWTNEDQKFHFIVGNPPFMSVKKNRIDYIQNYEEILYGHPNLYQLFLWWAVRSSVQNGVISFLIPQSILVGNFFQNLRRALQEKTRLLSITRMIDRKGVVGDADQQMMVLCLRVAPDSASKQLVDIRVTRNGHSLSEVDLYQVKQPRVVRKISNSTVIWIVSNNALDYTITERAESKCKTIAETDGITIGNGGYVWNQYKELLHSQMELADLPLISSASVIPFGLDFPFSGSHPSRNRQYSAQNDDVNDKLHEGPAILLQRTTPRKAGRRLVSGYTPEHFLEKHPLYFLENHVNYIKSPAESVLDLYGILGWLNSDILNFIFQLRNGTSHISIFELSLLPIPSHDILAQLSKNVRGFLQSSSEKGYRNRLAEMNEFVFDLFDLGPRYRERIAEVLSRKERE
ncbi:MAG: N-6 DNA methylase [Anaerolineales bacterium]|nr:N-6 DNA methylase [Anaerolineales bacterium]